MDTDNDLPTRFDPSIRSKLGKYVYALIDPRDNEIFYIGKGTGERVLSHSKSVQNAIDTESLKETESKKRQIISEINNLGMKVRWHVLARNLDDDRTALLVESAIIYAFNNCRGSERKLTNIVSGNFIDKHGGGDEEKVAKWHADPVRPMQAYESVLVFNVSKALEEGRSSFEATRGHWVDVPERFRNLKKCFAVGLEQGFSKCVIEIDPSSWQSRPNHEGKRGNRWSFRGKELASSELFERDWSKIVEPLGYWKRGNYLAFQFDGNEKYKCLRGESKGNWRKLPLR
jgi:uncharacterized protein